MFHDWDWKAQYDFAGNGTEIKDAYIRYTGFDWGKITIGQFKQPFGLEELTSSKYITFIERASMSAFAVDRRICIGLSGDAGRWHWAGSVFGQEESDSEGKDEGTGANGRIAWTPGADQTGAHPVTVRVTDRAGARDTQDFTIVVVPATATIRIDGVVSELNQRGEAQVTLEEDATIDIQVSAGDEYKPEHRTYTLNQLRECATWFESLPTTGTTL